jgi:hypothetical protein
VNQVNVASVLARLDGRTEITEGDWELAGEFVAVAEYVKAAKEGKVK